MKPPVASQWSWKVGDSDTSVRRAAAEWHTFLAHVHQHQYASAIFLLAPSVEGMGRVPVMEVSTPPTRGIVISAGGAYLEPAFISLYVLRQMPRYALPGIFCLWKYGHLDCWMV